MLLAATHTVGLKLSKRFRLGGNRDFEVATNILNLLNAGRGTEYARGGATAQYNTVAYLQPGNLQAARSYPAGPPVPLLSRSESLMPRRS